MELGKLWVQRPLLRSQLHRLGLVVVSSAAPGAVSAASVGVIAGGGSHHCGGRVARVSRVSVSVAGAGHGVHYIKQGQPEKQLQKQSSEGQGGGEDGQQVDGDCSVAEDLPPSLLEDGGEVAEDILDVGLSAPETKSRVDKIVDNIVLMIHVSSMKKVLLV